MRQIVCCAMRYAVLVQDSMHPTVRGTSATGAM